jgi:mannobiose 2-epimerase
MWNMLQKKNILQQYKKELSHELENILNYWIRYAPDEEYGGFYGSIDNENNISKDAPKGSVLNSRILWSFSAAYNLTKNTHYLHQATRAFNYIRQYFIDKKYGGVFWTVDFRGNPLDTKKQIYALAFALYGLSEYYKCSREEEAKSLAIELYHDIVKHSFDELHGGYLEAMSREWIQVDDLRLSDKDANEKKSMNTHLHLLEGFANLYLIWNNDELKNNISDLINIFFDKIIDSHTNHLILFFNEKWEPKSDIFSYGHDIEAAWLIQEAAEIIGGVALIEKSKQYAVKIAGAAAEGLDKDGGLWYEYSSGDHQLIKEKHSWPQAESMIGFLNAWEINRNEQDLETSRASWKFIREHILDQSKGEWFWGVHENYEVMDKEKVGIWKCPYHNSRACIEIIKRIDSMNDSIFESHNTISQ